MPIVTVTVREKKSAEFKSKVFNGIHDALVAVGVNERDRFMRMHELDKASFEFDPQFPDAAIPRTDDFLLIEILLGIGRSVKIKRQLVKEIAERLKVAGFEPEHVMVVLQDAPWENFSPAGGRLPHG
jgi:phenylpyruvate tautomerase PptA (4-oxalocrotonate tautomerase family)